MLQLFLFGIVAYVILYFLAKLRIFPAITAVFPFINFVLLTIVVIFIVIKSGLIRAIAMIIGVIVTLIKDAFSTLF
ncbi:hypothetical protein CD30_18105 [Ureibacillus massiliensis 4400831 = CIP 108448 = CCUG 49529]|uniref:Uncharacterized protein n=1 Tax=Ureibacillus massiliensis 4400831 = CIP 108448 = CCUG 49529 TaxID=1211035 RepID=A0A0A3J0D7_9BACL|nr:hypothetical protein [Ureibacillus massiliensis]KGR88623.1 hypothetical protein CD30_18105 [Ureibacillus massiliensis 4400831 = CIP 108448 = CCUG 49529]